MTFREEMQKRGLTVEEGIAILPTEGILDLTSQDLLDMIDNKLSTYNAIKSR